MGGVDPPVISKGDHPGHLEKSEDDMSRHLIGVVRAAAIASVLALAGGGIAAAREPVDPSTLNPAPPDFFNATCQTQGRQIVCDLAFSDPPFFDEPSAIVCDGTELLVSQTRDVVGKRYYDADGDLLRRHFREDFTGSITNPVSGNSAEWVAHNSLVHDLAMPGVIASGTTRVSGQQIRIYTSQGTVLMDAGRIVIDESNGEIIAYAGPKHFDDYFVRGDAHALDALCDALA
jgi:hypothetical protein